MTYRKWPLHKLLVSCILSTSVTITHTPLSTYQPPDDQKPPKDSSDALEVKLFI